MSSDAQHSFIHSPQYLSNCVSMISLSGNRYRLGSCDKADYILPRTRTKFGERGFHYSGPAASNTLPSDLHDITDTNIFNDLKLFCLVVHTDLLLLLYGAPPGRFVERRVTNLSLHCIVLVSSVLCKRVDQI